MTSLGHNVGDQSDSIVQSSCDMLSVPYLQLLSHEDSERGSSIGATVCKEERISQLPYLIPSYVCTPGFFYPVHRSKADGHSSRDAQSEADGGVQKTSRGTWTRYWQLKSGVRHFNILHFVHSVIETCQCFVWPCTFRYIPRRQVHGITDGSPQLDMGNEKLLNKLCV